MTLNEESPQLTNRPRLSGKTIIPRNITAAQVTSPTDVDEIDVHESKKILQEKEEIECRTPGDLATPPLEKNFGAYLRPILKVVLPKSEVSPSLLRAFPSPPPKSSATSRKQKDKGKARATLKVQKTASVNTQKPSDAIPPPVSVLNLGVKRSVDELGAPEYNEQNLSDADLEEGEIRSPSPVANKKQKTTVSSTPGIKPRPRSPRRRKSPSKKAQVPAREPSPRNPSPEPIRRGRLSRREPYRRDSSRRDSSNDSTNRSKSPSRRESRRDAQSNQRRRSRSPARRDSRRGTSPVRQILPTRNTSAVLPVRRGQETQNHASSSAPNQKQPLNASPAIPVHPVENSGNPASSSALSDKEEIDQWKIFKIMLGNHARTTKHRADKRVKTKAGILDNFHSLCSCIISFYYEEKLGADSTFDTMTKWKSLFSLIEYLLYWMNRFGMSELRPLCQRLQGLIRFRIHELLKTTLPATPAEDYQRHVGVSREIFIEYQKATTLCDISESSVGFAGLKRNFPKTFQDVCLVGDLKSGMILNNEDGGVSAPFVPFGINGPLHLAAIAARCILNEYIKSSDIDYSPIVDYRDFM